MHASDLIVDRIDPAQARDHLEMVDRILRESSQQLCSGGAYFVIWGVYSGLATVGWHFIASGKLPPQEAWVQALLLAIAIALTIWRARTAKGGEGRRSIVQREFFTVLWLAIGLAFVANVAMFNLFGGIASAAIWSFSEAIVLFFIAAHGNRRASIGGIAVIVSAIVANFLHGDASYYVLAAGMVAGYAGFGLAEIAAGE